MRPPVYCITMDTTPERHARAMALFGNLGLPVRFHVAEKDPQGGIYGCWRSHLAVWRTALAAGHDIAVVFEDDVEIGCTRPELDRMVEEAVQALRRDESLDVVHLHSRVFAFGDEPGPVKRGQGVTNCAAVVHVARLLARPAESLEPTGHHLDYEMFVHQGGPMFVHQGGFTGSTIAPGSAFGTSNDYGPLVNDLMRRFGYAPFVDGMGAYIASLRTLPRWARERLPAAHAHLVRWLQP